jgi:hypothetical protein
MIVREVKMKKISFTLIFLLVMVILMGLSALALADPGLDVDPPDYYFGEVEVGSFATVTITISNNWSDTLWISQVNLQAGSSPDFFITSAPVPGANLPPGYSVEVQVTYAPSALGYASATLRIDYTNGDSGTESVLLEGIGVEAGGAITIEDILAFFDAGVEGGTIQGTGPNENAKNSHLKVFEWQPLMVAFFLDNGADHEACTLLWHAYDRSDGQDRPKDFIKGQDVDELNAMILQLIADLGC